VTVLNNGNNIDSIIYSFKNMLLIYIIITLPFYFVLNSINVYYYALAIFIFILSYYLFYIFSKTIVEFLSSGINFIGMVLMAISILLLLLKYDVAFIIFPVLLSFSSSIIDNSIKIRNRIRNINNLFMILYFLLIIVFILFFGIRFELVYISFILISIALGIISIFFDNNIIEYKKVTLNKRLRFYIVSLSDIHRIKNLNALLIMILINSLIYLSIIMVFTFIPVLAIHYGNSYNKFIVKFLIIISISFFAYFAGSLIKNNFYYIVSFFSVPVFILSIIFIITLKNNFDYLYYGLFLIPLIALFMPGYYKYKNKKFMLSEVYYINKFINFFSMFFIIIAPLTGLYFYDRPRIVISVAIFPMFIVIVLSLKFINYSNVIHIITKKHKN